MAIAPIGTAAYSGSGSTTVSGSITVTAPAGIALGNLIVVGISTGGASAGVQGWTPPTGWTTIKEQSGGISVGGYCKIATATEVNATSFTFTPKPAASGYWSATAQRYSGVDTTTPLDGVTPVGAGSTAPLTLPAFSTSATTSYPIAIVAIDDTGPTATPFPSTWSGITATANTANQHQIQATSSARTTVPASTWSWTGSYAGPGMSGIGFSLRQLVSAPTTTGTLNSGGIGAAGLAFTPTATGGLDSDGVGAAVLDGSLIKTDAFTPTGSAAATLAGPVTKTATLSPPAGAGTATLGGSVTRTATLTATGIGGAAVTGGAVLTSFGVGSATIAGTKNANGTLTPAGAGAAVVTGFRGQFATLPAAGVGSAAVTRLVAGQLAAAGAGAAVVSGFRGKSGTLIAAGYGSTLTLQGIVMPPPLHVPVAATLTSTLGTATLTSTLGTATLATNAYTATLTAPIGTATLQLT